MSRKTLTFEEASEFIGSLGYKLITKGYIKDKQKIILKDEFGYLYVSILNNLKNNFNPRFAHKSNPYSIQNIKLWCKLNNKPFELLDNQQYITSSKNLKWKCLKENCKENFEATWICISRGRGCPFCNGRQVGLSNCLATKNPELTTQWHPTKNGDLTPHTITPGSMKKAWWLCKECGHEWFVSPNSRNRHNSGCPKCKESKGEKQIDLILTQNGIPHSSQYFFNNLVGIGGGLLKFDVPIFWDKEQSLLRMLIEFDGEQHFRWVKGMMTKKQYETLQIHDEMKNKYCDENNIKLLRIPYYNFDKLEEILQKELNIIQKEE